MKRKKMINDFTILSLELSYFLLVFEHKSINAAARKIGQDPGNISRILSRLEKTMEGQLFIRHQSGLRPTPKAESLYRALKTAKEAFIEKISFGAGEKKEIRIGFSPTIGFTHFTKYFLKGITELGVLPEFHFANSLTLMEAIKKRELDFVLVANAVKFPGTIAKTLSAENLVLASANGTHGKTLLVSAEMMGLERIVKTINYESRWVVNDYFVLSKFLVEDSDCMGIIPERLLEAFPKLKAIDVFQKEGKITAVTWPSSPGVALLKWARI